MSEARATLLVIEGNDQGVRFDLSGSMVIGRGAQNPIRILDTEASRVHARIVPRDGGWVLEDLNSSNGTFVNGQPIKQRFLESGDQIRLGRSTLVFALPKQQESSLMNVDLIGGSSLQGHSQIVRTFSPDDLKTGKSSQAVSAERLRPADILRVMGNIAEQAVRPSMTMTELLERVLRMILHTVHADRGCMLLIDTETGLVVPQASAQRSALPTEGQDEEASRIVRGAEPLRMPISKSIVDYVLKTGQAVRTSDPLHDTRFDPGQSILQAGVQEALCVPMQGRMALLGVIYLDLTDPQHVLGAAARSETHLTDEQLRLLTAVGRQCALAIENFRYQQSLVDAERLAAIGQTIATLSHHIKNILQGVRGGSYLIDMGLNQNDQDLIRKGWSLVEKNQDKIYHLVMDMLTFSKERAPRMELASLNEIVADVCELMESRAAECGVRLIAKLGEPIPSSSFDPEGIHRAVLNIVTNAIDAAEQPADGGLVTVTTSFDQAAEHLVVKVQDNGPGIPASLRDKIFQVFESTKGARGTGIGLAVSRKILREHGGDILLDSEPNHGACFTLEWPYSSEAAEGEHPRGQNGNEDRTLSS
ncbi:MAG: FHA domain-containing protein [Planctomycetaceae bacterium]|nr:FHA domain-containing protein [Planctomycetaceae bacterium]